MIRYRGVQNDEELNQILVLQQNNLARSLTPEEIKTQGFVTVEHTFDMLKHMNTSCPHIIAKDGDQVVGYTLTMTQDFGDKIEVLKPMFKKINSINYNSELINESTFLIMGQVCIDKAYRSQGVFAGLYNEMKNKYTHNYKYLITEIAFSNKRSLRAHAKVGFESILQYPDSDGVDWVIVLWDWK